MKKTIAKKEEREEKTLAEAAEDEDDEEEEEEEPEGKWYYMGGNSFGELILNIIALAVGNRRASQTCNGRERGGRRKRNGVTV